MKLVAEHVKTIAKDMANPLLSEESVIRLMRMGATQVMHEIRMAALAKKSIKRSDLFEMFDLQEEALKKLTPGGQ